MSACFSLHDDRRSVCRFPPGRERLAGRAFLKRHLRSSKYDPIVDEYSRFPFAFPCASVDSKTVIAHFNQLFALFGVPAYIHSDRRAAFMSNELTTFFRQRGIACSRTSVYNAPGN